MKLKPGLLLFTCSGTLTLFAQKGYETGVQLKSNSTNKIFFDDDLFVKASPAVNEKGFGVLSGNNK